MQITKDEIYYSGIDAMVHAIEAYTSRHQKNVLSDTLAMEALKLLSANIRWWSLIRQQ